MCFTLTVIWYRVASTIGFALCVFVEQDQGVGTPLLSEGGAAGL